MSPFPWAAKLQKIYHSQDNIQLAQHLQVQIFKRRIKKAFTLQWPTPGNTQLQTENTIEHGQTKHPRSATRSDSKLFQSLPAALHRRGMAKNWSCEEEPDSQHEEAGRHNDKAEPGLQTATEWKRRNSKRTPEGKGRGWGGLGGGSKNLMDFEKRIAKKVLKCAGAGSTSEDPIVNTQKGKIKFLLGNAGCSLTVKQQR